MKNKLIFTGYVASCEVGVVDNLDNRPAA